jgi:uncharacterized caspase-like protein
MRMLGFAVSLFTALFVADSALANSRVAFVVGNGAYKHADPLPNPTIDAKAMARLLRNAGFEVVEGTDLGREAMTARLREFAVKTQGSEIALFFYAGHGMSVNGKNYLIPVDADLKSEMDVMFTAIDVDVTLDQTMSDAKVKLVLLDACRDNPFAAKIRSLKSTRSVTVGSGLAEMKSGEGTLIAFATSPGQVALDGEKGGNSPFTRALLNHIATPGVEIQQAMTRVRAQVNEETKKQQLPWGHTNLIGSVYLNASAAAEPNRPEAAPVAAAPEAPAQVQTAAVTPSTTVRSAAPSEVEIEFWRSIKDTNKPEELNAYLLNYPNGQFRPLALARLAALDAQEKAGTRKSSSSKEIDPATLTADATLQTEDKIGLDRRKRAAIQKRLTALGFDVKATGKFDDDTREVIQRWQAARSYPSSGYFNKLQYQALMAEKPAAVEEADEREPAARPSRSERRAERRSRRSSGGGGGGGPAFGGSAAPAFIGGVIGGAFRRR